MSLQTFCCLLASTFPKCVSTALLVWGYWTVVIDVLLPLVPDRPLQIGGIVIVTVLFVLSVVAYYLVVEIGGGSPLEFSTLCRPDYVDGSVMEPPSLLVNRSVMVKQNGGYRFCNKCKCWKPDRCHHCSSCSRCVLRMDHHCPWFAECIGFKNHKFFVQFLVYASVFDATVCSATSWANYGFFVSGTLPIEKFRLNVLLIFFIAVVFWLCLSVFTLFTIYQLLKNRTTIESYEYQRYRSHNSSKTLGNVFDLGYKKNWCSIMGNTWGEWLLPIRVRSANPRYSDGLSFEVNEHLYNRMEADSTAQERLSNELENYRTRQREIREEASRQMNGQMNGRYETLPQSP